MRRTTRNYFISAVEENTDKLKFLSPTEADMAKLMDTDDIFIHYKDGYLQIDDDFLMSLNDMEFGLYAADGSLLYGKNSIIRETYQVKLSGSHVFSLDIVSGRYLIYDRRLSGKNFSELWIRGIAPLKETTSQLIDIAVYLAAFLPFLIIIILLCGYFAAKGIIRPIKKIEETTTSITDGNNLSLRISDTGGRDELAALSGNFNKMLDRLETSFEMEKRFASDASHELRTPVSVILAQAEFSLEKERQPEEYVDSLEVIKRQGKRMNQLIGNMLSYTRLEQRIDNYPFEKLDFSVLVSDLCSDMTPLRINDISLEYNVESGIMINGNAELLARMLQNLLENAYKYGRQGGNTKVILSLQGNNVKLLVEDDGIGIAEEQLEQIFDRFFRVSNKSSITGSGLGLSIVKKIVDMHGGNIDVSSREGLGTTFTITFSSIIR
ncbi:ATPase/histidine kinase/DNA gyrase B/HSP90 domain protein [Catonella morbi ATCC 51271]|uniref:histidine kinase n=2 Tax=Catonella TaxID=43996 RepID=V2XZV6_9FIRM|nr:ATPase/histidine kinase/DNA gyrase B/HSP90 domain protein [Catonella morbi ATCC 51271]